MAKRPKKIRQIARKEKKHPQPAVSQRVAKARKVSATATASRSAANQASTASSGTPRVDITALRRKRAAEKLKRKKYLKAQRARAQAAAGNREELLTKAEMIALMEKARSRGPGEMERWLARLLNRFDKRIKSVTQKCDEMQRKSESNQRKIAERELKLKEDEKTILKMKEEVARLRRANDQAARA